MKFSILSLSAAVIAMTSVSAIAYDFDNKFYGKMSVGINYSLESLQSEALELYEVDKRVGRSANRYTHNLGINVGYSVYYVTTPLLHPFVGFEGTAEIPLKNQTRYDITTQYRNIPQEYYYYNHASFDLKAGLKFNQISQNFSLQLYTVFGVALLQYFFKDADAVNDAAVRINESNAVAFREVEYKKKHDILPAINYGAGIETIYNVSSKWALTGGFEYKRVLALKKTKNGNMRLETNQFLFRFGVQIL